MAEQFCPGCRIHPTMQGPALEVTLCTLTPMSSTQHAQEGFCSSSLPGYLTSPTLQYRDGLALYSSDISKVYRCLYCSSWHIMPVTEHTTQHTHTCCTFASFPQSLFPAIYPPTNLESNLWILGQLWAHLPWLYS